MIAGFVDNVGVPIIPIRIAETDLMGIVDSGFNEDLELPERLYEETPCRFQGTFESQLAGGQVITEDWYLFDLEFDGEWIEAMTTFAQSETALIGTRLMQEHRLLIDFVGRSVLLTRTEPD